MELQSGENPQHLMGSVVRGGLILAVVCIIVLYLLLGQAISRRAYLAGISQQLNGQRAFAAITAAMLDGQLRRGQDALTAFNELGRLSALQFGAGFGGFTLADPEGKVVSQFGSSEYLAPASLEGLMVRDPQLDSNRTLTNYAKLDHPSAGLLYTAAGTFQHQSVAVGRIAATNWALLVHSDTLAVEEQAAVLRTYLLVGFLVLAALLLLFMLLCYHALAGVFNRAVRSAEEISSASRAFQESLGVMRGPLHNIQGLTDMLCMAADQDERQGYGDAIKAEVGKLIALFKKSEF